MKKMFLIILSLCLMTSFCSCDIDDKAEKGEKTTQIETQPEAESVTDEEAREIIADWLSKDHCVSFTEKFMEYEEFGFSQHIEQYYAEDGSFSFFSEKMDWNYQKGYDLSEKREYYYRYEGDDYICYMKVEDQNPVRSVMTREAHEDLKNTQTFVSGVEAILPSYIKNFSKTDAADSDKTSAYTFTISVEDVLKGNQNMLWSYFNYVSLVSTIDVTQIDEDIVCTIEVEKDTLKPLSVSYDFSALMPSMLTDKTIEAEKTFDSEAMIFYYEFDYEMTDTTYIPDYMLEDTAAI